MKKILSIALIILFIIVLSTPANALIVPSFKYLALSEAKGFIAPFSSKSDNAGNTYSLVSANLNGGSGLSIDFDTLNSTPGDTYTALSNGTRFFLLKHNSEGDLEWYKYLGLQTSNLSPRVLSADSQGNIVITGIIYGASRDLDLDNNIPGDTISSSSNDQTLYMAKYNSSGTFVSVKQIGHTHAAAYIDPVAIEIDNEDNIYLNGWYYAENDDVDFDADNTVSGDTVDHSNGNYYSFLVKYNDLNVLQWVKIQAATGGDVSPVTIGIEEEGSVYLSGEYYGTSADMDRDNIVSGDTINPVGDTDIYFAKFSDAGVFQWVKNIGSLESEQLEPQYKIKGDDYGNVYVQFYLGGTTDLDPANSIPGDTHTSDPGESYSVIAKYSTDGVFKWKKALFTYSIDATTTMRFDDFTIDPVGNVYATGGFSGEDQDFDPDNNIPGDTISSVASDGFTVQYNADGELTKLHGHPYQVRLITSNTNSFTLFGLAVADADLDPEANSPGDTVPSSVGNEMFVAKFGFQTYQTSAFSDINVVNVVDNNIELGSNNGELGKTTVHLENNSDGQLLSDIKADFTEDLDWSSLEHDIDVDDEKLFMTGLDSAEGIENTTVYLPSNSSSNTGIVYCPDIDSLGDLSASCTDGEIFNEDETKTVDSRSMTLSKVTIDSDEYWKLTNFDNGGVLGVNVEDLTATPTPTPTTNPTNIPTPTKKPYTGNGYAGGPITNDVDEETPGEDDGEVSEPELEEPSPIATITPTKVVNVNETVEKTGSISPLLLCLVALVIFGIVGFIILRSSKKK